MQIPRASADAPSTILITGVTGFIGGRLASAATAEGIRVRSLTRSEWSGPPQVPAAERFLGSLPFCVPERCLAGVDAVVHCAGQTGPGSEREARAINVEGTVLLARRARDLGVSRFVFLSSQSASERAPSAYGRTKHQAERELERLDGIETVILRPGLVYGPGSRGLYQRMRRTVERLPVLPLLGGGKAPVQPIHVDDLCRAILRALEVPVGASPVLSLGDPEGIRLADLLQAIALAGRGRRKPILPIPLAPVTALVRALETLGVPLPVTSDNLQGLGAVQLMETRADLERLGVELRPLAEGLREERQPVPPPASLERRPVGVVLVGAGRIGTLHALTAARSRGLQLTAVVDKDRTALARLAGLGIRARFTTSLDEALAGDGVDAVIIATPVSSHLPLVRRSLAAELAVLVEKPLAVRSDQLAEYARLAAQMPPPRVQVGYLAPRYPQVEHALERLRAGAYGEVQRFLGLTLLTLIQERGSRRWETQPELSGGGVLINSGGHVMSMVRAAFGDPLEVTARSLQPWSERVEDTLVADLGYTGFHGRCLATWSIDGYPRQENRLVVWTDRGVLTLTNNTAVFELAEGGLELAHQLEFDVGFNLMPDYAGGGIAAEHRDLQQMVRRGSRPAMDLRQALGVERLVFHTYEAARPVKALEEAQTERSAIGPEPPRTAPPEPGGPLILDLRSLTPADVARALGGSVADRWAGFLVHPAQLGAALESGVAARRLRVTVPDFLYQARLIASGRHRELLAHCGLRGGLAAFSAVVGVAARARGASFWVAARGLLAADLARIPRSFDGKLLLQSYLTDLAAAVGRPREATRLVLDCRRRAPRARVGVHTNRLGDAGGLLALDGAPDAIHFLSSPRARGMTAAVAQLAQARPNVSLTAEVGEAPAAVHGHAAGASEQWRHGASGLVVGVAADAELMERHRAAAERAWQEVFPGLPMPEEVL